MHVGFDIVELASQDLKPQQEIRARISGGNTRYVRHLSKCYRQVLQQQLQPSQLRRLAELQDRRQQIWTAYDEGLADIPQIFLPKKSLAGDTHGLFTYCIRTPKRNVLAKTLLDADIYTTLRYHPLHMNPLYGQTSKRLPHSEQLNQDALSIPLHPRLSDDDVDHVIQAIHNFADRHF